MFFFLTMAKVNAKDVLIGTSMTSSSFRPKKIGFKKKDTI